jgi:DNA modification methylase
MGKGWDASGIANNPEMWSECLRVLKPGGYLLSFSATRTYHRMACAIEDAGFEIRDMIEWVYGSGFPKSLNIGKAVDKLQDRGFEEVCELGKHIKECRENKCISRKEVNEKFGAVAICNHWEAQDRNNALPPTVKHWNILKTYLGCSDKFDFIVERIGKEREVVGLQEKAMSGWNMDGTTQFKDRDVTKGTSEWEGKGTALKPAHEPICMARKPLAEKTVAENCLKWGTGGINIDESRVETTEELNYGTGKKSNVGFKTSPQNNDRPVYDGQGRFPANLIHDNSEEVRECFPTTTSGYTASHHKQSIRSKDGIIINDNKFKTLPSRLQQLDTGNASRFFKSIIYQAKASKSERGTANSHPTVKPVALMEYLIKMVTPTNGIVLDPFMGSGSTGVACVLNDFEFVGIDLDKDYCEIARARIEGVKETQTKMF